MEQRDRASWVKTEYLCDICLLKEKKYANYVRKTAVFVEKTKLWFFLVK